MSNIVCAFLHSCRIIPFSLPLSINAQYRQRRHLLTRPTSVISATIIAQYEGKLDSIRDRSPISTGQYISPYEKLVFAIQRAFSTLFTAAVALPAKVIYPKSWKFVLRDVERASV